MLCFSGPISSTEGLKVDLKSNRWKELICFYTVFFLKWRLGLENVWKFGIMSCGSGLVCVNYCIDSKGGGDGRGEIWIWIGVFVCVV